MKKLVILAIVFLSATVVFAAPEISLRAGLDIMSDLGFDMKFSLGDFQEPPYDEKLNEAGEHKQNASADTGFNIGAEILFPIANILKIGGGFAYLADRTIKFSSSDDESGLNRKMVLSAIPIYATIQVNPIPRNGLYLKGNFGLSILNIKNGIEQAMRELGDTFNSDYLLAINWDVIETFYGIYASIGAGYEFPFGLFTELAYDFHSASQKDSVSAGHGGKIELDTIYTYTKVGIIVGYKFKLGENPQSKAGRFMRISAITGGNPQLKAEMPNFNPVEKTPIKPIIETAPASATNIEKAKERRENAKMSFKMEAATFQSNSSKLSMLSKKAIKNIVDNMKAKKTKFNKITIEGHTDSSGKASTNMTLSRNRAKAVMDEFANNGISREKLDFIGFGSTMPIQSNKTAKGKQANRRVEIFVE